MQGKAPLVTKSIQRLSMRILRSRRIAFSLIQKRSRLLSGESVIVKANAVHLDDGRVFFSCEQSRLPRWQFLQLPDSTIDSLDEPRRSELLCQYVDDRRP